MLEGADQKLAEMFGRAVRVEEGKRIRGVVAGAREDDVAPRVLVPAAHIINLVVDHEPGVRRAAVFCYFGPCVSDGVRWRVCST